jgi:serine/threonine protein kinase/tetratricopeptide (TPR) repeat protein
MTGTTVSHYRILSPLGTGGMSIVYLAEDLRLGRQVALKFLPPALEHHPAALERLRREARLTSALNHPYICTIHDIGEHNGRTFLVMERLEGTTLKRLIDFDGAMALERALRLGAQIADALAAAHAQGIVHRDVKPGNVFITPRDDAKVTDFGLAKLMPLVTSSDDSTMASTFNDALTLTSPGEAVGTIAYMSPEQARGEPVDARSDLFSLGVVLYEMVTGHRAFPGSVPAVVFSAILNHDPVPPQILRSDIPGALVAILARLMSKIPSERYQSGTAVRDDLMAVRVGVLAGHESPSQIVASRPRPTETNPVATLGSTPQPGMASWTGTATPLPWRDEATGLVTRRPRKWIIPAAMALLAAVVASALTLYFRSPPATPLTERDSIMLGEFRNTTGDAVFDGTLREALAAQLDQSPFLDIVAPERVNETLQLMGRASGSELPHDVAREACVRMNAKALIEGAIRSLGEHFVITLTATGCENGDTLAINQAEVDHKEDVLEGVGRTAQDIRGRLGESLATIESFAVPIEQATTPSLDALRAYTLGQARRAQGAEIESVPFFLRAVEIDPHFASAWNALSLVYGNLGETEQGAQYGVKAYAEREHVSERERLAITYQYHDRVTGELSESIAALELWKRLYPRDYRPANSLAVAMNRTGNYERASQEARDSISRGPDRGLPYSNLAYALRGLNRFDESRKVAEEAMERKIETLPTRRLLYQLAVMRGDSAEAQRHLAWAEGRPRSFDLTGAQAQVAAYRGQWSEARELYRRTVEMAREDGLKEVASAYAAQAAWTAALLGFRDEARASARPLLDAPPQVALLAVAALAQARDLAGLNARIDEAVKKAPRDTLIANVSAPVARAALLIAANKPKDAVDVLRPAVPYDAGRTSGLTSYYLRAEALRLLDDDEGARTEYTRLMAHRGSEPFAIFHAVASLGLARAAAQANDVAAARQAYAQFFETFKGADRDLPLLLAARAESARLDGDTP